MEREKLEKLWAALNTHSVVTLGEYIDPEWEGENGEPPAPSDAEIIEAAIEYLEGTV